MKFLRFLQHCVRWMYCPDCNKPVDQFEAKCFYCGSTKGPEELAK